MTISQKRRIPDTVYRRPQVHKKKKPSKSSPFLVAYRKAAFFLTLYLLFRLFGLSGLITWRTERDGHWIYLLHTAMESLDNNTVFEGAKLIGQEFIFDLFNLGGWIKYLLAGAVIVTVLQVFPFAVKHIHKFLRRNEKSIRAVVSNSKQAIESFSLQKAACSVENSIRYGVILPPDDTVRISRSVGIVVNIGGKEYFGGIDASGPEKVKAVNMIARDGSEIVHSFSSPVSVIPGRKRVYLCGSLTDANGTAQKKIELSTFPEEVFIGSECYSINVSSL